MSRMLVPGQAGGAHGTQGTTQDAAWRPREIRARCRSLEFDSLQMVTEALAGRMWLAWGGMRSRVRTQP